MTWKKREGGMVLSSSITLDLDHIVSCLSMGHHGVPTFSSKLAPSMPNFFIRGSAVDFNKSTCNRYLRTLKHAPEKMLDDYLTKQCHTTLHNRSVNIIALRELRHSSLFP